MTGNRRMKAVVQYARQRGTSLVEVMVAIVVLTVVALGMGGYLFVNQAALSLQRDRTVALEIANGRLEELRALSFDTLTALLPATNYSTYYFYKLGPQSWTNSSQTLFESTNINGATASLLTAIRLTNPSNYLDIAVSVALCRANNLTNQVVLETFYYEP